MILSEGKLRIYCHLSFLRFKGGLNNFFHFLNFGKIYIIVMVIIFNCTIQWH